MLVDVELAELDEFFGFVRGEAGFGGAHRTPAEAVESLGTALVEELEALASLSRDQVRAERRAKFMAIG